MRINKISIKTIKKYNGINEKTNSSINNARTIALSSSTSCEMNFSVFICENHVFLTGTLCKNSLEIFMQIIPCNTIKNMFSSSLRYNIDFFYY